MRVVRMGLRVAAGGILLVGCGGSEGEVDTEPAAYTQAAYATTSVESVST